MQQRVVTTTADPEVFVEVTGDLRLTGSDLNEVFAETNDELNLTADPAGAQVKLFCGGDCTVRAPRHARMTLHRVGGDARPIKDLAANLTIGDVGGDLVLRQLAGVTVGHVGGDVSAKKIGALSLAGAGGDVSARGVEGAFASGFVGGNLYLRDVEAGASGQAGGEIILHLGFASGQTYAFSANGDIVCRVPPNTSARLTIQCNGEIAVDVPGARTEDVEGQQVITLGDGAASVSLQTNGDVTISDVTTASSGVAESGDDFGEALAAQIEAQVAAKMAVNLAEMERELKAEFGDLNFSLSGMGRMNAQEIAAQVRRAARQAQDVQRKAKHKVEAAQRKAERIAERAAQRHAEPGQARRRGWRFTMMAPTPPRPPAPPDERVSDQERLAILRMLEQGKITAAEAEKLLAALEGKG